MRLAGHRTQAIPRCIAITLTLATMGAVGLIDYVTGYELSFSVFYLIAICLSFWLVGRTGAFLTAVLSILIWIVGDWAAGQPYSSPFILVWNAVITMAFYVIVLALLSWLKASHEKLEERVRESTAALREEMAERERLEQEILEISENERLRIGCDLHDNLCQHLTGTAIAAQNIEQDLRGKGDEKGADDVEHLVDLVEGGIDLAREIARGLAPVHLEPEGLTDAFEELAATTRSRLKVECRFEHPALLRVEGKGTGIHLYRIAQEAITNAVRHGKAGHLVIRFAETGGQLVLTVRDDGCGLTARPPLAEGAGLRIMKHRAALIGANFLVESPPGGGTVVTCILNHQQLSTPSN